MNYLGLLNDEEKTTLCMMLLSGKLCKHFFVDHEPVFQDIKKGGFRAKSLSEKQALSIVINNIDNPHIVMWFNNVIEFCLKNLQEEIAKHEKEGSSHNTALAKTLLNSNFFCKY